MADRIVIDLDALIPDTQYVKLDGIEHAVEPASVDMYLTVMKKRRNLKAADTELDQMEQAIDLIVQACPSISRVRLGKLPLRALMRMTEIIESQMADVEETTEDEVALAAESDTSGE